MKINLTKKQYQALAKTVYLGNWMANAHRTGREGDERLEEYNKISDYIFSLAPEFGFSEHYEHDLEHNDEEGFNTEVSRLYEEYDEEAFWDSLADELGKRDFFAKYLERERKEMSKEEHFEKLMECIDKYEDEFVENGLERLKIINSENENK